MQPHSRSSRPSADDATVECKTPFGARAGFTSIGTQASKYKDFIDAITASNPSCTHSGIDTSPLGAKISEIVSNLERDGPLNNEKKENQSKLSLLSLSEPLKYVIMVIMMIMMRCCSFCLKYNPHNSNSSFINPQCPSVYVDVYFTKNTKNEMGGSTRVLCDYSHFINPSPHILAIGSHFEREYQTEYFDGIATLNTGNTVIFGSGNKLINLFDEDLEESQETCHWNDILAFSNQTEAESIQEDTEKSFEYLQSFSIGSNMSMTRISGEIVPTSSGPLGMQINYENEVALMPTTTELLTGQEWRDQQPNGIKFNLRGSYLLPISSTEDKFDADVNVLEDLISKDEPTSLSERDVLMWIILFVVIFFLIRESRIVQVNGSEMSSEHNEKHVVRKANAGDDKLLLRGNK